VGPGSFGVGRVILDLQAYGSSVWKCNCLVAGFVHIERKEYLLLFVVCGPNV